MPMSTQEWGATLGLFLAHPELLIAIVIITIAISGICVLVTRYIDQAQIDTLKSRIDGAEAALRENKQLKQKVEALERENTGFRRQIPLAKKAVVLNPDTDRVLVHMSKAQREMHDFDAMAAALGMERNVLRYHLNQLKVNGWADCPANHYSPDQKIYWRLTSEGLQRAFERAAAGNLRAS